MWPPHLLTASAPQVLPFPRTGQLKASFRPPCFLLFSILVLQLLPLVSHFPWYLDPWFRISHSGLELKRGLDKETGGALLSSHPENCQSQGTFQDLPLFEGLCAHGCPMELTALWRWRLTGLHPLCPLFSLRRAHTGRVLIRLTPSLSTRG